MALLVYGGSLGGPFFTDDRLYITGNRLVRGDDQWREILTPGTFYDYLPVLLAALRLQFMGWGLDPLGYRIVNLALHLLNAWLVRRIMKRLGLAGAGWVSLIFLVHPLNVSTVAWISEQKNTLSFSLAGLATLAVLRAARGPALRWGCAAALLYGLAILTKAAIAPLPVFLLILFVARDRRLRPRHLLLLGPWFAITVAQGLAAVWGLGRWAGGEGFDRALPATPLPDIVWKAGQRAAWYIWKTFVPTGLGMRYPDWQPHDFGATGYLPALALVAGSVWAVAALVRSPAARWPLGFAFYGGMLSPCLGFLYITFFEKTPVADHWQYHAMPGLLALAAGGAAAAARRALGPGAPRTRAVLAAAATAAIGALAFAAAALAGTYGDPERLWMKQARDYPDQPFGMASLGDWYLLQRRFQDARDAYRRSLAIRFDPDTASLLGFVLLQLGDDRGAEAVLRPLVTTAPSAAARRTLGAALIRLGELPEAYRSLQAAVAEEPDSPAAHLYLGRWYVAAGRPEEAMREFARAAERDPYLGGCEPLMEGARLLTCDALWDPSRPRPQRLALAVPMAARACKVALPHDRRPVQTYAEILAAAGRRDEAQALRQAPGGAPAVPPFPAK